MSTKSTPGPWEISTGITHTFIKHKNIHICEVERDAWEDLTADANAKLIAAAPELLEAVILFRKFFDSMPKGQLGNISYDIGMLNDAFLTSGKALKNIEL